MALSGNQRQGPQPPPQLATKTPCILASAEPQAGAQRERQAMKATNPLRRKRCKEFLIIPARSSDFSLFLSHVAAEVRRLSLATLTHHTEAAQPTRENPEKPDFIAFAKPLEFSGVLWGFFGFFQVFWGPRNSSEKSCRKESQRIGSGTACPRNRPSASRLDFKNRGL